LRCLGGLGGFVRCSLGLVARRHGP
jgi:hypothetical protein